MENTKKDFREHGAHGRFFRWAKEKMTGEEAFDIMYGEKSKDCPKEMKTEFAELFDRAKKMHAELHNDRSAFMDKWKEYMPEDRGHMDGARQGGVMEDWHRGFPGHGGGFGR